MSTNLVKTLTPLDANDEVLVFGLAQKAPAGATELGMVEVGDTGFSSNCGWEVAIEKARQEARKAGGNIIKIIAHKPPSALGSSCDRIKALILKLEDPIAFDKLRPAKAPLTDSSWNYAKLFVYRSGGAGFLIGYNLYLGDSLLCRVTNNSAQEVRIGRSGKQLLWAATEAQTELPMNIEFGRTYYLRCSIEMGIMVGHPHFVLVEPARGEAEYKTLKKK